MKSIRTVLVITGISMLLVFASTHANAQKKKIGKQTWTTANLDVSSFKNGDMIPEAKTVEEWQQAGADGKPAWCYYDFDPANGKKYGKLYNWHAVKDTRGLAPDGWHIPSDEEWTALIEELGGESDAAPKMKNSKGWEDDSKGTNKSGFSALPAGLRSSLSGFDLMGDIACWWSSTEYSDDQALLFLLSTDISVSYGKKVDGLSVRCIQD